MPPFRRMFKVWEEKRYFTASLYVAFTNLSSAIIQFVIGWILLSPLYAVYAGVFVGIIVGQGKGKAFFVFSIFTLIFEWGAFASAGAIGMGIGDAWIMGDYSFAAAWSSVISEAISTKFFLIPVLGLIANGFLEAAGPIYFGIKGVPGIEAARNQIYK